MSLVTRLVLAAAAAAAVAACSGGGGAGVVPGADGRGAQSARAIPAQSPSPTPAPLLQVGLGLPELACTSSALVAGCALHRNTAQVAIADPNLGLSSIPGYHPQDLWAAYGLPAPNALSIANGPTIAIVDAYDNPTAELDLAQYRLRFGMPACASLTGCFQKVAVGGLPLPNPGWNDEIALDLAMASTACPTCKLLLIETADAQISSLAAAVDKAAAMGAVAISSSFGVPESAESIALESHWNHPGIALTASSGDAGFANFPATSRYVTAVGGTNLAHAANARGWSETPWAQSGSGCSASIPAPSWQAGHFACDGKRAVADVSFVASTAPGIAIYSTSSGGWLAVGGTSAGAPFIAGLYARAHDGANASSAYAHAGALNAVAGGAWTLGTPQGLGAF